MSETTRPNRKLLPGQLGDAEHQRRDVIVRPEAGTTIQEMLIPEYWTHVAKMLRPLDRIEVRPMDGSWWAELLVRVVEPFSATVHVLRAERFGQREGVHIEAPAGFVYRQRGARGWIVIRSSDNITLQEALPSIEAAEAWLMAHLRKLAA